MIERLGLATLSDLEAALVDLGTVIELPSTPDLATIVGARLRAATAPTPAPTPWAMRVEPRRLPVVRSLRRSLLLAAAIALLLVGAALGVRYGLGLLEIEFGPAPSATPTPSAARDAGGSPGASVGPTVSIGPTMSVEPGAGLGLGLTSTLEAASAEADFALLVPEILGPPDEVYVGGTRLRGQVAFGYLPRPDLPENDLLAGLGLLITQNRGRFDEGLARKLVGSGVTTVEPVNVDGAPGYWIAGAFHFFWYLAPDGTFIEESERQVGDTLVWERDGVLYRVEGADSRERALEIAASMH